MDVSNFVCCICKRIPDSVAESGCCHSLFCWDCVLKHGKAPCPSCDKILEPELCNENVAIQKLIEKIPVQCKFEGCDVWFTQATVKEHDIVCEYAAVMCPNSENCGILKRKDLAQHERENCAYRIVRCHGCEVPIPLNQLQSHLDVDCSEVIISCNNNCLTKGIRRAELAQHLAESCPNAPIDCPFVQYGCEHLHNRAELDAHLRDDVHTHLLMTTSKIEVQQREIAQLRGEVHALQIAPRASQPQNPQQMIAEFHLYLYDRVVNGLADFRPLIDDIRTTVSERIRWSLLFWLIILWFGMSSVNFAIRCVVLGFWYVKGFKRFVRPYKRHLMNRSIWHWAIAKAVYISLCIDLFLLVLLLC